MNKVLGKGLSSLMMDDSNLQIEEINIEDIEVNPFQPRKRFDSIKMSELMQSITEYGILQPIVVCKNEQNKFTLIAGERRYIAAKNLGMKTVPAILKELKFIEYAIVALIENIQRENLNPIDEAMAFKRLQEEMGCNHDFIASKVGKSRPYITNSLRLLALPADIIQYVREGLISSGHARLLIGLDDPVEHAQKMMDSKMSVRAAENYINNIRNKVSNEDKNPIDNDIAIIINSISKQLKLEVNLQFSTSTSGKLCIEFQSLAELDNLLAKLSKPEN